MPSDRPKLFTKDGLEIDATGNLILNPVMGWIVAPIANISVLLKVQYADSPAAFETGGMSLQFVLRPQQCLELADLLTKKANALLQQPTGDSPN